MLDKLPLGTYVNDSLQPEWGTGQIVPTINVEYMGDHFQTVLYPLGLGGEYYMEEGNEQIYVQSNWGRLVPVYGPITDTKQREFYKKLSNLL